jgi:pyruvate dehydrogenase E1 component beta subunit
MVGKCLNVAEKMEKEGISVEVVDPISLVPLDMDTIIGSIKKTGRVIVAYNGPISNGAGAEIAARIAEQAFDDLDCPLCRIAEKDSPLPFSPVLESYILPQEKDIEEAIKKLL